MPGCTTAKKIHLHVRTACIAKLTRRERDPSTPHPCTTAPSTRHSRGFASTVASAGSPPASPPCPTHPGREASPDRKKQGTRRLAAAEHQLLQLVVHAAAVAVRQLSPCGSPLGVCLSPRGEALLSLSLPGGGMSSPTRRERAERKVGRRVGGVTWCVCVCVYLLNCT